MNKLIIGTLCILALGACSKKSDATLENFTVGMNAYLAKRGDLCLAKYTWPIDVTQHEMDVGGRNALQMPVLEKVGLVRSSVASVEMKDADSGISATIKVKRYDLTEAGKKYYLTKAMRSAASDGTIKAQPGDFCAARLSLDKVVEWKRLKTQNDGEEAVVTYTYKIAAAPWTQDAEVQKVFPMVTRIVRGAGVVQLQETFRMTEHGWVATNL